jgi:hypothetical protein
MKIGRNEPCPCGSGKKYKKCCKSLKTLLGVDHSDPPSENIGRQEAMLADLLGGIVDHELGRADLLNMARDDELDTPEAQELMKALTQESTKLDKMLAAYGEEYDLPDPLDAEDEEEGDRYDGYEPEPYYDHLESQYEEAKENGLLLSLKVLPLDEEHSDKDLVEAVNYYNSNEGDVKKNAPLQIFNKYEQRMINKDGNFRPALWAMLLCGKFTEALQDRTAFLMHANKYGFKGDL